MIDILIVDDSNDKVADLIKVIRDHSNNIFVDVVIDFITAQKYLMTKKYDLLILDINLPIRIGELPSFENGKNLLKEISRKSTIQSPYYIIIVTQYSEENTCISDIWKTVKYSPDISDWGTPLINLIKHISKTGISESVITDLSPTIFLEGRTDENILREAIKLFRPELLDSIVLKSEKGAGASWVARKIIAWAFSLNKSSKEYIKAIGILDGDNAGKTAHEEINRVVKTNGAEGKTFKIIKLSPDFARHIIPIRKKGLDLPVSLEEMFNNLHWTYAGQQGWLEPRTNADSLLVKPEMWNKYEISLKDYLLTIGLTDEEGLYLNSIKDDCKERFVEYVMNMDEDNRKLALNCFKKLVLEIESYFLGNPE